MNLDPMLLYILLGSFGAVGGALAVGTGAALVRYHRTGTFPATQRPDGSVSQRYVPGRGHLAALWARVVIGVLLALWAVVEIARAGIL